MPSAIQTPRTPALLVAAAVHRLRVGEAVAVEDGAARATVLAAEPFARTPTGDRLATLPERTVLVLTGQRVAALTGTGSGPTAAAFVLPLPAGTAAATLAGLIDPLAPLDAGARRLLAAAAPASGLEGDALDLVKLGGLLPALIVLGDAGDGLRDGALDVPLEALRTFRKLESALLQPVSEAQVPLLDSAATHLVAFRPADGGADQIAIVVGRPERQASPLVRLHSECFTGDLLGSLRCDCGDQLRGAIRRMAEEGAGVLLYLAQEGRGIGLANKLRAYALQDAGLDTIDANTHLGFEPDERDFWAAATMLSHLGIRRVRLLTNNPAKIEQLDRLGIEVTARIGHSFAANPHNRDYLRTKAVRSGHLLALEDVEPGRPANGDDRPGGADALPRALRLI